MFGGILDHMTLNAFSQHTFKGNAYLSSSAYIYYIYRYALYMCARVCVCMYVYKYYIYTRVDILAKPRVTALGTCSYSRTIQLCNCSLYMRLIANSAPCIEELLGLLEGYTCVVSLLA